MNKMYILLLKSFIVFLQYNLPFKEFYIILFLLYIILGNNLQELHSQKICDIDS